MQYRWKTGSMVKADPQIVGEECARIERERGLTPENLLDESRREDAPLHGFFEWDNDIAAEKYRISQASYVLRSIEIVDVGGCEPVRAFVPIKIEERKHTYVNVAMALSDDEMRAQVLKRARKELYAFKAKYANLKELSGVFREIEKL